MVDAVRFFDLFCLHSQFLLSFLVQSLLFMMVSSPARLFDFSLFSGFGELSWVMGMGVLSRIGYTCPQIPYAILGDV